MTNEKIKTKIKFFKENEKIIIMQEQSVLYNGFLDDIEDIVEVNEGLDNNTENDYIIKFKAITHYLPISLENRLGSLVTGTGHWNSIKDQISHTTKHEDINVYLSETTYIKLFKHIHGVNPAEYEIY